MYPGLQHYVYKLLHLQQGEMLGPVSSCPTGRKRRICLKCIGRAVGVDWSLTEDTVRSRGNGTRGLAYDCVSFAGRGVLCVFILSRPC